MFAFTATTLAAIGQLLVAQQNANTTAIAAHVTAITQKTGVWGFQMELGSFASSYIPTTTAAVTRAADVLTYASAGNVADAAGSAYAELTSQWTSAPGGQAIAIGPASGVGVLESLGASTTISSDDGAVAATKSGLTDMRLGPGKRASSWSIADGQNSTGDGSAPANNTYDGSHTLGASFGIGGGNTGLNNWYGNIRNVRLLSRAWTSSELVSVTA